MGSEHLMAGDRDVVFYGSVVGLVVLCVIFAWVIVHYSRAFFAEATGERRWRTLVGAATVIAIVIGTIVGTFTQQLPVLTKPPAPSSLP